MTPLTSGIARIREVMASAWTRRPAAPSGLLQWLDFARRILLLPALLGCLLLVGRALLPTEQIRQWYVWRYFEYWGVTGAWISSCFCAGFAVLRRLLRSPLPLLEHATLSFALGLLCFFLMMFVGGLAGWLGSPFFFVVLLAPPILAGVPVLRYARRLRRHLRAARRRPRASASVSTRLLWGLGVIALFLFYLPSLVPAQIGYDSAWYHVPLGEHYARLGKIAPLPEGWFPGAVPHLPSIVYCFAFLLPKGQLFDYVELAAHLEFASLLMALLGIPALVRRLVPQARAHVAWLAYFTFPAVYYYDGLIGGDQFSAVWGVPIVLALLRAWPELSWRYGILLASTVAGLTLTKYSASGLLIGPALGVGLRMLWLPARSLMRRAPWRVAWGQLASGLFIGGAVLLLTTPLWAKNWLWYGDPFYPLLHKYFASRPWSPDAAAHLADYQQEMADYAPTRDWAGVKEALKAVVDHALKPADYSPRALRGSLFTLMCACLPFIRARPRLWGVAAVANLAIFGWFMQLRQDRYLMAFMPLMAAVIVAVAIQAWRAWLLARPLLVALFSVHTFAGLSVFAVTYPNNQYRKVLDFILATSSGTPDAGMGDLARFQHIGETLPSNAVVVVHGMHAHAGLGHPSISDWPRTQLGLSYGRLSSPAAIYAKLKSMGATHLLWQSETWPDDSYAGDLRFYEFVHKYTAPRAEHGLWVGTMPAVSPPATPEDPLVAFLGCDGRYAAGLYRFSSMTTPNPRGHAQPPFPSPISPISTASAAAALAQAHFVIYKYDCGISAPAQLGRDFVEIGRRAGYTLYAHKD